MVDYTREMRRGRTLQERERDLQPINKQLDDERVMIKDYTHDKVVSARAAGERPFDLERERKVSAVMKQEREKIIEFFDDEPEEALDESLQVELELELQRQRDEEEEEAKERVAEFESFVKTRERDVNRRLNTKHSVMPEAKIAPVVDVDQFRKDLKEDFPHVDVDNLTVDDSKNRKVSNKEVSGKKTLQERLREIERDQERQTAELERLQKDDEYSL